MLEPIVLDIQLSKHSYSGSSCADHCCSSRGTLLGAARSAWQRTVRSRYCLFSSRFLFSSPDDHLAQATPPLPTSPTTRGSLLLPPAPPCPSPAAHTIGSAAAVSIWQLAPAVGATLSVSGGSHHRIRRRCLDLSHPNLSQKLAPACDNPGFMG